MKAVTLYNAKELLTKRLIKVSPVYEEEQRRRFFLFFWKRDSRFFEVTEAFQVHLSNGMVITIPEGFTTDLSSVPRWLWSLASPFGNFLLAAIIHDFLYKMNIGNRRFADIEMFLWSVLINDNQTDNMARYRAVRLGGSSWWRKSGERIKKQQASKEDII